MNRKQWISVLAGVLVSVLCLFLVLRGVNWGKFLADFATLRWGWCLLAIAAYLGGHVLRGFRASLILRPYCQLSTGRAAQVVLIGYAANNILPLRLGEVVRAYVLAEREQISHGISLSTLFVERVLDGLAILAILGASALLLPPTPWLSRIGVVAAVMFLGASSVLILARIWQQGFFRLVSWGAGWFPQGLASKVEGFGHKLVEGAGCLRWDRSLLGVLGSSLLIWIVEGGMFLLLLPAFGLPMSPLAAYLAMSVTNLGVLVPSTPGHMGVFHFFCTKALVFIGVASKSVAFSFAVVVHALQLVPVTLLGLWAMYAYGFSLRSLWSAPKPQKSDEPTTQQSKDLALLNQNS